jgi:DNA polymerase III epsilon subunit-like protein
MNHLNGHLLTVMDVETTGRRAGYHDIVQIALLPLEPTTLEPHPKYQPFYQNIRPEHPERIEPEAMAVNGLDLDDLMVCPTGEQVEDALMNWFKGLGLPVGKRLIPLCQNSPFDVGFMSAWLGVDLYGRIFSRRGRDTMHFAIAINDREAFNGFGVPFHEVGLKPLCKKFGINIDNHHDAMADCIATARLYRELLRFEP